MKKFFPKRVVFIIGAAHSGSTLLELILNSHPDTFGLGEFSYLANIINNPEQDFQSICGVCERGKCEFWNNHIQIPVLKRYFSRKGLLSPIIRHANKYYKSIYEYFFEWSQCQILIDKSLGVEWVKKQLIPSCRWKNMTPLLVFITRDGRAVVNSLLRKYPERGIRDLSLSWKNTVEKSLAFYREFPFDQKITISYETLALRPSEVIRELCLFLRIDYHEEMLEYWKYDHHSIEGNLGTRSLIFNYRSKYLRSEDESMENRLNEVKSRHGTYYQNGRLGIKLDSRWKDELTEEQIRIFDTLAGKINKQFVYPE